MVLQRPLTALLVGLLICADAAFAAGVTVSGVRLSAAPSGTRVVLDLTSPASHALFTLTDPDRVVVDVRGARISGDALRVPEGRGAVRRVRVANRDNGDARVVLDLAATAQVRSFLVPPDGPWGHRLVIDLPGVERSSPVVRAAPGGSGRDLVIAVDSGHGGKDPGAIGRSGVREKDIVLQIARRLAQRIDAEPGMRAFLVRDGDYFLSLHQRVSRARMERADLFVSIHVNAHPQQEVGGIETFYLNLATNTEAMRVAALENATSTHSISEMQDILSDLLRNAKINESSILAKYVQNNLISGLHEQNYPLKNLGVKQAPFYVLLGAQMPAVLAELAFITNPAEARLLSSQDFTSIIARQIAAGIAEYVEQHSAALR